MPETSIPPPAAVARPSKPVSETLLNEKVGSLPTPPPSQLLAGVELVLIRCSGTVVYPQCSSAPLSVLASESSSRSSYLSAERGLLSSVWVSVLGERMRSAMAAF